METRIFTIYTIYKYFLTGVYLYMKASGGKFCGDIRLISPQLPAQNHGEAKCLRFSYAVHGRGIGALSVVDERATYLWGSGRHSFGVRDLAWPFAEVTLGTTQRIFVLSARILRDEIDIAIDNLHVRPLTCDCTFTQCTKTI